MRSIGTWLQAFAARKLNATNNMSFFAAPGVLNGEHVLIEPLDLNHSDGLFEIGVDPAIWRWLPEAEFTNPEDARQFVVNALALKDLGGEYPFAIIDRKSGKVAGTTRYLEISEANRGLEIGWTWYGVEYQRTAINTETKYLLLSYAFEQLGAIRMQFKTDSRNLRSQTAIQRIGGCLEGTLRNHRILPKDGYIRDSVYFSIVDTEWPDVKSRLQSMLLSQTTGQRVR